jgi:hypothetical protein
MSGTGQKAPDPGAFWLFGVSHNCRNQAITLRTRSMSEMGILRQLTFESLGLGNCSLSILTSRARHP